MLNIKKIINYLKLFKERIKSHHITTTKQRIIQSQQYEIIIVIDLEHFLN